MKGKGARDLPGLTAGEIRESQFSNELELEEQTQTIARAAKFLNEHEFDVWEFRGVASDGTVWRDALDKFWLVDHESGDIKRTVEWGE